MPWLRIPPAKYRPFLQLRVYKRKTRGTSLVGEKSVPASYPLRLWSSSWKSLVPGIVDSAVSFSVTYVLFEGEAVVG